jgi:predicted nucleic acid-binding protein
MGIYLDTSCLWKLLVLEPGSAEVAHAIRGEREVVISPLAELEAEQQLIADRLGGRLSPGRYRASQGVLKRFRETEPFSHPALPEDIVALARKQIRQESAYCRTPDRLHLGAMEALGLRRLLTNDDQQAEAAKALGFSVILPR